MQLHSQHKRVRIKYCIGIQTQYNTYILYPLCLHELWPDLQLIYILATRLTSINNRSYKWRVWTNMANIYVATNGADVDDNNDKAKL